MPTYMIEWNNGDLSFATAANADEAREMFDEVGEPTKDQKVTRVPDFMVHLKRNAVPTPPPYNEEDESTYERPDLYDLEGVGSDMMIWLEEKRHIEIPGV